MSKKPTMHYLQNPTADHIKVKVVDLYSTSTRNTCKALRYSTRCQGISQFYLHTLRFMHKRDEPYLPLPSQPQLVLIYRPRRDGRLSRPWCEVTQAKIQTHNLPIAKPALYHSATSTQYNVFTACRNQSCPIDLLVLQSLELTNPSGIIQCIPLSSTFRWGRCLHSARNTDMSWNMKFRCRQPTALGTSPNDPVQDWYGTWTVQRTA